MTIAVDATRFPVEQVTKQLDKLVNVIKVRDLDPENMVSRELALIKVHRRRAHAQRGHPARRDLRGAGSST